MTGSVASVAPIMAARDTLIARYEELRSQVLQGVGRGMGLVLFLREGMRAWLESWSDCTLPVADHSGTRTRDVELMPLDLRGEMARILAGMAMLRNRKERR